MSDAPAHGSTQSSEIKSTTTLPQVEELFTQLERALWQFNTLMNPEIDRAFAERKLREFERVKRGTVQNVLIPGLNRDLPADGKSHLTENEVKALIDDNQLAGVVFHGGLRESIIAGKASVAGLATLLPEARELLRNGYMQEALNKGAITLEDLSKLDRTALGQAQNLVATGNFDRKTEAGENNFRELTGLLRLPEDREVSLGSAFDAFRTRTSENNPGHAQDSHSRPLPAVVDHPPLPDFSSIDRVR